MAKNITTGLVLRGDKLQWTSIQTGNKKEDHAIVERAESSDSPHPEEAGDEMAAVSLDDLLHRDASRLKGSLHFAIPAEKALLRVMDLPTTDDEEIEGMVELQIDKVSPFPVDLMYISSERIQETENGVRVLVAAAQKQYLDQIGQAADDAGLVMHRIDVDMLCWVEMMLAAGEIPEHGRHVLVLADRSTTHLAVFDHQSLVLLNSLADLAAGEKNENVLADVAEELDYTMTSLENEWGVEEYITCTVWHWNAPPAGTQHLEDVLGCQIHLRNLGSLPDISEGVTTRACREAEGLIDIAPTDWKLAEERRRLRRTLTLGSAVVMAVWLIGLIGFFIWVGIKSADLESLRAELEATEEPARQVKELQSRIHELSQYTNRTYSALECFREVIETMPAGVELSEITYDKSMGVRIRGESRVHNNLNLMIKGLTESELFTEVQDVSIDGSKMKATALIPTEDDS